MSRASTRSRSGRPPRTSRADILEGARRLIERDGVDKVTIRRLATEIGTSPATVYYHVRDKDDLYVQLLNDYADQIPRPELPDDPRERILVAATLMHDVLADRPWVVEILTADDLLGDAAMWLVEVIVSGAVAAGAEPEGAVHLYRNIWYFTAGEILIRAHRSSHHEQLDRPTYRAGVLARLDAGDHPQLTELADRWESLASQDTYDRGLRALVDGSLPRPE